MKSWIPIGTARTIIQNREIFRRLERFQFATELARTKTREKRHAEKKTYNLGKRKGNGKKVARSTIDSLAVHPCNPGYPRVQFLNNFSSTEISFLKYICQNRNVTKKKERRNMYASLLKGKYSDVRLLRLLASNSCLFVTWNGPNEIEGIQERRDTHGNRMRPHLHLQIRCDSVVPETRVDTM
ncbi:hypothetical protein ANTRET_LOCUS8423 [Anthophora retusa]